MQSILLLHGALGSGQDLKPLKACLQQFECDVHILTFSGHGGTEFQTDFGISQFSKELEDYIHKNNLEKPLVFGYSMGGYVALYLALSRPDIFKKIICFGTKFEWTQEFVKKETILLDADLLLAKNPGFTQSLEFKHGALWKELLTKTSQMMHHLAANNLLHSENLAAIHTQILLGLGDKDKMVSLNETVNVFHSLPHAALFVLPKSKHPLEFVNIDLLSKICVDFLQEDH